ncbi:hypothetical protein A1O3_00519 [Capronia epimyces CBS 606.96]|uniref:Uncharacterized protein n=1 Tax=Capronia epimyces CBS 606.96 TaxID=1182542 RepID=W9ZBT5_9EURO|nr:uncharacterized protein A1O3_00519 [Capronia epimyces CBS 606.96]EXJ91969.1 hypothetical protein A1O3_00519 [Capronia epimyces CBS 606.96]
MSPVSSATTIKQQYEHTQVQFSMQTLVQRINDLTAYLGAHADGVETVIQDHDKLVRKNERRKQLMKEKDNKIQALQETVTSNLTSYERRHASFLHEKADLTARHSLETAKLQAELAEWKRKSAQLTQEVDKAKNDAELAKTQLDVAVQTLAQWEQYTSHMQPLDRDKMVSRIDEFFDIFNKTIQACFIPDLSADILVKRDVWSNGLKQLGIQICDMPFEIPPLNTKLAKLLRVAAAMHVISSELTTHVFQPCYIPGSTDQSATLQQMMRSRFEAGSKQRQLMRAFWLGSNSKTQEELGRVMHERSLTARDMVVRKLSFMCNDGDGDGDGSSGSGSGSSTGLASRLEEMFTEAAKLWTSMQYSSGDDEVQAVVCGNDSEPSGWKWEYLDYFGQPLDLPNRKLLLFPGFNLVDSGAALYAGNALFTDQKCVVDAESEYRRNAPTPRAERSNRTGSSSGLSPTIRRLSLSFGSPSTSTSTSSPQELKSKSSEVNDAIVRTK